MISPNHPSTKVNYPQTKVELKIIQLTIANIAQMGRHETVNTRSENYSPGLEGSIPVRDNFFSDFILLKYNLADLTE